MGLSFLLSQTRACCFKVMKTDSCPEVIAKEYILLKSRELVEVESSNTAIADPYISNTLSNSMFCGNRCTACHNRK